MKESSNEVDGTSLEYSYEGMIETIYICIHVCIQLGGARTHEYVCIGSFPWREIDSGFSVKNREV